MSTPIDPAELISSDEAARRLHLQKNTLTAWRHRRVGPPYVRLGRRIFYRNSDLAIFIGEQRREPHQAQATA
jgi:helix-turn-helix protein